MNPDKFQQAWQVQASQTKILVDADFLLRFVQRDQQTFRVMIFWRDFREVAAALVMIPVWFYLGLTTSLPWTWWLTVPALFWIAGFMLVYRKRHPQKPSEPNEPLLAWVKNSLAQVEDQIWLLRNVFWWYLLPPSISIAAFFVHTGVRVAAQTNDPLASTAVTGMMLFFLGAVYGFIYWMNQRAVRKQLEPRREELLAVWASLRNEED